MTKLTNAFALTLTLMTGATAAQAADNAIGNAGSFRDEAKVFMAKSGLPDSTVVVNQPIGHGKRVLTISSKPADGGDRVQSVVVCHSKQTGEQGTRCKFTTGGLPIALVHK